MTCLCDCIYICAEGCSNACKSGILYCISNWYYKNLSISVTYIGKIKLHSSYWLTHVETKKVENRGLGLLCIVSEEKENDLILATQVCKVNHQERIQPLPAGSTSPGKMAATHIEE